MTCIAGIIVENKFSEVPSAELKGPSGAEDYHKVRVIASRLMLQRASELTAGVLESYIQLWEARAVALIDQPVSWNIVESIVCELSKSWDSSLNREELVEAIQRGMVRPLSSHQATSTCVVDQLRNHRDLIGVGALSRTARLTALKAQVIVTETVTVIPLIYVDRIAANDKA